MTSIAWFRRDLRVEDNPAWSAACAEGPVVAVFVLEPSLLHAAGPHRRSMLLGAVAALGEDLRRLGGALQVVGPAIDDQSAQTTAVHVLRPLMSDLPARHERPVSD